MGEGWLGEARRPWKEEEKFIRFMYVIDHEYPWIYMPKVGFARSNYFIFTEIPSYEDLT